MKRSTYYINPGVCVKGNGEDNRNIVVPGVFVNEKSEFRKDVDNQNMLVPGAYFGDNYGFEIGAENHNRVVHEEDDVNRFKRAKRQLRAEFSPDKN